MIYISLHFLEFHMNELIVSMLFLSYFFLSVWLFSDIAMLCLLVVILLQDALFFAISFSVAKMFLEI